MDHRITVDFTGLCVFVTNEAPEKVSVILGADPDGTMRHRPLLSFNVRNLGKLSGGRVDQVIQLPDGNQIASWSLDKSILRLKSAKGAYPPNVMLSGPTPPKSRCPRDPGLEMDLGWVPSLKRLSGEGRINPVYMSDHPVPDGGRSALAARIEVESGFLYANAAVNRQAPAEFWTFKNSADGDVDQFLADTVRLELSVGPGKPVVFEATRFETGVTETLELRAWNDRTEVSITNLPEMLPQAGGHVATMPHFGLYYELLDPPPARRPIPTKSANASCGKPLVTSDAGPMLDVGFLGIHPVKCTPGYVP